MRFLPVPGYEHLYEVNECGEIRSFGMVKTRGGSMKPKARKTLSTEMGVCRRGRQNYLRASLWESGKRWKPSVHQIVALAFIGACPTGGTVNHKDGNKLNNHYSNLEYVTRSQNQLHAYAIGLQVSQKGEARPLAKLTPEDVHYILRREKTAKALAVEFGVSESLIYMLLSGRRWKHIPRESL